jgi:hypothetical protein
MKRKEFYSILFNEIIDNRNLLNSLSSLSTFKALSEENYNVADEEIPYFFPFYMNGRLFHFYPTDALLTFLMSEYELKRTKISGKSFYAILANEYEIIYHHTKPDKFTIRFNIVNIEGYTIDLEVDGYSTKVLYKTRGMKRPKLLELDEINVIFVNWMREYLTRLYGENHTTYIL